MRERGYSLCSSIDTVTRQLAAMLDMLKTALIVPWMAAGPAPIDGLLNNKELLVQRALPKLGLELSQQQPQLRAQYNGAGWRQQSEVNHGRA